MKVLIRCEECGRTTTYGLRICKGCREKNLRHFKLSVRREKGASAGRPLNPSSQTGLDPQPAETPSEITRGIQDDP
jgi:hypothetical protein